MLGGLGQFFPPLLPSFAVFQQKFQLFSAVFRMFSISPQPISRWLRGFFVFPDSFQFVFKFSILHQFKKARNSHEHHYRHRPRLLRYKNGALLVPGRAYKLRRTRTLHPARSFRTCRVLFCLWHWAVAYPARQDRERQLLPTGAGGHRKRNSAARFAA